MEGGNRQNRMATLRDAAISATREIHALSTIENPSPAIKSRIQSLRASLNHLLDILDGGVEPDMPIPDALSETFEGGINFPALGAAALALASASASAPAGGSAVETYRPQERGTAVSFASNPAFSLAPFTPSSILDSPFAPLTSTGFDYASTLTSAFPDDSQYLDTLGAQQLGVLPNYSLGSEQFGTSFLAPVDSSFLAPADSSFLAPVIEAQVPLPQTPTRSTASRATRSPKRQVQRLQESRSPRVELETREAQQIAALQAESAAAVEAEEAAALQAEQAAQAAERAAAAQVERAAQRAEQEAREEERAVARESERAVAAAQEAQRAAAEEAERAVASARQAEQAAARQAEQAAQEALRVEARDAARAEEERAVAQREAAQRAAAERAVAQREAAEQAVAQRAEAAAAKQVALAERDALAAQAVKPAAHAEHDEPHAEHEPHAAHEHEHEPHAAHEHEHAHDTSFLFGTHEAGMASVSASLIADALFNSESLMALTTFIERAESTQVSLAKVRRNLAIVIYSATRNESENAPFPASLASELRDISKSLLRDAASSARATQAAREALVKAQHEESAAHLLELFEAAGHLFEAEMEDRQRYSADLTRARLDMVASFIDQDATFRSQFSPASLAALHESNSDYKDALSAYSKALAGIALLSDKQAALLSGKARQAWVNAKDALKGVRRSAMQQMRASGTGIPVHADFRLAYATLSDEGARVDVELCDKLHFFSRKCYTDHVDAPPMPVMASAEQEVKYFAAHQFPRMPPATIHFEVPAEFRLEGGASLRELAAAEAPTQDILPILFQLVYSLAGMYSIMGLQLNCFKKVEDLQHVKVYKTQSPAYGRVYSHVLDSNDREDWRLPVNAPYVLILPDYRVATCWRTQTRLTRKFVAEAESAADVQALLWLLLQDPRNPKALRPHIAESAWSPVYEVAAACFGKRLARDFGVKAQDTAASVYEVLQYFETFRHTNSSAELPLCVW